MRIINKGNRIETKRIRWKKIKKVIYLNQVTETYNKIVFVNLYIEREIPYNIDVGA